MSNGERGAFFKPPSEEEISKIGIEKGVKDFAKEQGAQVKEGISEISKISELYQNTPLASFITETQEVITAHDPSLLTRSKIDLSNIDEKLKSLYPEAEDLQRAQHKSKVWVQHIGLGIQMNDSEMLRDSLTNLRNILNGDMYDEEERRLIEEKKRRTGKI
jgi:hypothetical protein